MRVCVCGRAEIRTGSCSPQTAKMLASLCPPKNPACPSEPVCEGRCASVGNTLSQEPQHIYQLETASGDLINAGRFYFVSEHLRAYPPLGITSALWNTTKICFSFFCFYIVFKISSMFLGDVIFITARNCFMSAWIFILLVVVVYSSGGHKLYSERGRERFKSADMVLPTTQKWMW